MLSKEENDLLTRTGPGTPMGTLFRRFWLPALLSEELPAPDCPPTRVTLLGENLVAFRDSEGRSGLLNEHCPHRGASLFPLGSWARGLAPSCPLPPARGRVRVGERHPLKETPAQ